MREKIPLPAPNPGANRQYTFIISDSYGDGLCCDSVGNLEPGYTLWEGDPEEGKVVVSSKFEGIGREVTTFVLEGEIEAETQSPSSEKPEVVDVKLTITLDQYPEETGFYIEDMDGKKVKEVLPGIYRQQNQIVEETISLHIGLYKFTIVDAFGDGIIRENSYYRLDLIGDDKRPALLVGTGRFVSVESQVFLLEGVTAQYPLSVKFLTDSKPRDFGFYIKRLDLIQSDALVASVAKGSYETPGQFVSETLMVQEGALYRIVFQDASQDGIEGGVTIVLGSSNSDDLNAITYTVDGTDLQEWQVKAFTGELPVIPVTAKSLYFRIKFDSFPNEIEWILLASSRQGDNEASISRSLLGQEVIAYGPLESYSQNLEDSEYLETIRIPDFTGQMSFTMIVTDFEGDGGKFEELGRYFDVVLF